MNAGDITALRGWTLDSNQPYIHFALILHDAKKKGSLFFFFFELHLD